LHTVLQQYAPADMGSMFDLQISEGATIRDVLAELKIVTAHDSLIFVINHHMVEETVPLADGDKLDIIPAISGGCALPGPLQDCEGSADFRTAS